MSYHNSINGIKWALGLGILFTVCPLGAQSAGNAEELKKSLSNCKITYTLDSYISHDKKNIVSVDKENTAQIKSESMFQNGEPVVHKHRIEKDLGNGYILTKNHNNKEIYLHNGITIEENINPKTGEPTSSLMSSTTDSLQIIYPKTSEGKPFIRKGKFNSSANQLALYLSSYKRAAKAVTAKDSLYSQSSPGHYVTANSTAENNSTGTITFTHNGKLLKENILYDDKGELRFTTDGEQEFNGIIFPKNMIDEETDTKGRPIRKEHFENITVSPLSDGDFQKVKSRVEEYSKK